MSGRLVFLLPLLIPMVAACQSPPPEPQVEARPVLSLVVEPRAMVRSSFVGVVTPQVSVDQAFRVGGTLVSRAVDVGDSVAAGAVIASLETTTLDLAVETAQANLLSAEAQYANAAAAEGRLRSLQESDVVAVSNLEQAQQQTAAARASVVQAQSRLLQAEERLGYARLAAPFDGVVTAVGAETGAVVSPGQKILTLAQTGARDLVIDVPEAFAQRVQVGAQFMVVPQLDPDIRIEGKLREIAPEADPVTRSLRLKIGLVDPPDQFWLGTTASASLADPVRGELWVPQGAVLTRDGKTSVWVVDESAATVTARPVSVGAPVDGQVPVLSGLAAGDRVVTAGVNDLENGQAIAAQMERAGK
ncbi:efflux RND transporter periplasmic adaptor subunit [Devosia sp. PTR5]|uniref:Efflux RND transporter periplasmic adaptor subunit n=1 Tax=Devosia oryzisoli TaxID=2774138 RepID=A0A927FV90_9HYPH|nr:efflux RND transporter periplasmic adaptor subunit [Devosia oryzisoli]MBD8066940.1 efflux RND transporter periplasmic adaptor subunit [Devosia oryzisoli]